MSIQGRLERFRKRSEAEVAEKKRLEEEKLRKHGIKEKQKPVRKRRPLGIDSL